MWREVALGLALFAGYVLVTLVRDPGGRAAADRNARWVLHAETWLHLDVEASANAWLVAHPGLVGLANHEYATGYLIAPAALFVWLYVRRPRAYAPARTAFALLTLVSVIVFLLVPVTPPRLLPDLGLVDTVGTQGTFLSWGSSWIELANHLAAMPSIHVAWALWVSVVLADLRAPAWAQVLSGANVAVTTAGIVATANHFVLDAVGGAAVVWTGVALAHAWYRRSPRPGRALAAADAFYWDVESTGVAQVVGGIGLLGPAPAGDPSLDAVRERVARALPDEPLLRRRLTPGSRWRRPRWVEVPDPDLTWHVTEVDLAAAEGATHGIPDLMALVARLGTAPFPTDRPMWRIHLVRGLGGGRSAMVLLAHHTLGGGYGAIAAASALLDPPPASAKPTAEGHRRGVGRFAATIAGIAQLATDGTPRAPLATTTSPHHELSQVSVDLAAVRGAARAHNSRVTDLVLTAVAGAVCRVRPDLAERVGGQLRVAVPLVIAEPSPRSGNVTSGVMVDLPLGVMPERERLALVAGRTHRLRTASRALASRAVVARGLAVLPVPMARWFARTVYGRRFFHGIVSNLVGPSTSLGLVGVPIDRVVPVVPLAPGAPIAVGALGWNGTLCIGVTTDAEVLGADAVCSGLAEVLNELGCPQIGDGTGPQAVRSGV